MIHLPGDVRIYEPRDIDNENWPLGATDSERSAVTKTVDWARTYLDREHSDLGRSGPVCPFVGGSLERQLFLISVYDAEWDEGSVISRVEALRKVFVDQYPRLPPDAMYKTLLVLFPNALNCATACQHIEHVQRTLKEGFVESGLMIGQFYPDCEEPGLWNDEFRPLRSPVPLLAIRHLVATDFPFLAGNRGSPAMLANYFRRFGGSLPPGVRELLVQALGGRVADG